MSTLKELQSGALVGSTELSLSSCNLKTFPEEIFNLAETLELLNLSQNQLSTLPDDFDCLKKLRILFLSENNFTALPKVLAKCTSLTMIGFKSNQISNFYEDVLPLNTRWLILTDNQIETLPDSIGKLNKLQKCMLAGNKIKELPESMKKCQNLELLRISANQMESLPTWLFALPKLSWLACAGNPCIHNEKFTKVELNEIHWEEIAVLEELGKGASGIISKASLDQEDNDFAVKIFKAEVTSDGHPEDEMQACLIAGNHDNLTTLHGKFHSHPEEKEGLILSLIPPSYKNLGNPPSFESCTRDTYVPDTKFAVKEIIAIVSDIASATAHLHGKKIMHGDLYAHNILINDEGHCLFGDFGAATCYAHVKGIEGEDFEKLEVRAFGCLLDDLLQRVAEDQDEEIVIKLQKLKELCMNSKTNKRVNFSELFEKIRALEA